MFKVGQKFKHCQGGYIHVITETKGKTIRMESTHEGQILYSSMTEKDLKNLIKAGYYTEVSA